MAHTPITTLAGLVDKHTEQVLGTGEAGEFECPTRLLEHLDTDPAALGILSKHHEGPQASTALCPHQAISKRRDKEGPSRSKGKELNQQNEDQRIRTGSVRLNCNSSKCL